MSSQKYAVLSRLDSGAKAWRCTLINDTCGFTSYSNAKPICDRCPVAKEHKNQLKRGRERVKTIFKW